MLKDILEINFPEKDGRQYATLSQATVTLQDMAEKTITTQIKVDGEITPDFSFDWEVEFKGEKYIMPLRKPQGVKDTTSLNSTIDLTFQHWAIYQLKRWYFFSVPKLDTGIVIPNKYIDTVSLNLKDFYVLFGMVLDYYYGDTITIDLNDKWEYDLSPSVVEISHSYMWDVLIKFYELYGVRWQIEPNGDRDHYVIKVGYPTTEVSHIFEYGFDAGLMKVKRQIQDENIRNMIIGRGGDKNLPYRYFKKHDDENETFSPDPDWIPELKDVYFSELHGVTFRSYIQGWKARHIDEYRKEYPAEDWIVTTPSADMAYAPWAWEKGYSDEKFDPVEYVKDDESIRRYGELMGGLDNNEEIYPTIQGVEIDGLGRIDETVEVEEIESDKIEDESANDSIVGGAPVCKDTVLNVPPSKYVDHLMESSGTFGVPDGKYADLFVSVDVLSAKENGKAVDILTSAEIKPDSTSVKVINVHTGEEHSASGIPPGTWKYRVSFSVHNMTDNKTLNIEVGDMTPKLIEASVSTTPKNVWNIWVKNLWGSEPLAGESPESYSKRVWLPILGDRTENEAKIVFSDGMLAMSEDYEFTIVSIPEYDTSKELPIKDKNGNVVGSYRSHWCITLAKSDADLDATGALVPSTMRFAEAGDHFFFIGIDMPHMYVVEAEKRLDNWKKDELDKVKDIRPTLVVGLDKVRIFNYGNPGALVDSLVVGNSIRIADKRLILNDDNTAASFETLYLQSVTYTYSEPTETEANILPDVEIVLSNKYETVANPVEQLSGEISSLQKQLGSISNVAQIVRAVGDKVYLRKDLYDRAAGVIDFMQGFDSYEYSRLRDGAQFGASFAEGGTGFGGKIDGRGDAWLGGLHLRDFLEVPELRYNRTEISIGNSWHAPGGGVIEKVMPDYNDDGTPADTGTVTLRLEDGEIGAVAVGDLCQGIFHDEVNPSNNATADSDDGRGNFHFAGFCSVYFKITEIKERGRNSVFKYRLRELSSRWRWQHHPSAQMHFVAYGSVTYEDRKTSRYATRTYERYLVKVNGWELTSKNIAAQFGDLSNLSLFGLQMSGYSAYLNNIYMSGRIEQLDLSPRIELEYDNDNFIAPGQTKCVRCRVLRGFEDITGAVTKWSVTRVSDSAVDTLAWLQKDKVQNFAGEIEIAYDDLLGAADAGTTFTFRAETDNKTATASITLRRNPLNGEDGKDGTDYTQNLLLGSEFPVTDRWTTGINVTIDTDRTFEGRNSVKCAQSGLTANAYRGIQQSYDTNLREGDEFTASAWYYCENPAEVDGYAALEIQVFNGSERIKTGQTHLDLTKAGEWHQAHTTVTIPKEATHIVVALYLSRNGTVWFASPKLERGVNERPVWSPNPADRIPEPVQQYYLSTSDTVLSGGSWTDSKPLYVEGCYYWTRTKRLYGDGTVEYTDPVCVTGEKGQDGAAGKDGINGVNGTDYTNNLLRNSDFADGFDNWTASSIVELDAAMTLDGRVSALIAASGLDANKYYGLSSLLEYTGAPVDMTFSLSARTDDRMSFKDRPEDENLSRYPYMEIRCLNADKIRLKTIAANVLPSAVDEWQRISVSGQIEEGTRWIEVAVYIPRNGRLWVNGAKLEFGDNPATVWTPYAKGLDAYTVMLSNESHVFEGDTEKAVEASTECVVTAYKGTVARPVTIGAVTGAPSGMTVVRADNNTVSAKIKVSVTPTLTTRQGVLRIPVAVDGIIFEKTLSWTLALKGAQGDKGDKGDEGIQGCLYRVTQWAAERDYRNDSAEKNDGLRYVDVVIIPDYSLKTKGRAYRCVKTHQSTGDNAPGTDGGNDVWEELNEMAPIYTPLLLADNAVITLLQSNQVIVMKDDGTTVNAALGRGKYPLWIGAADPEDANFKVDDEGKAKMTEAEVSGKVTAGIANGQRVELQPDNKAMKIYDEDGVEAGSFEGNTYSNPLNLFGSTSDAITMKQRTGTHYGYNSGITYGRGKHTFTGNGLGTNTYYEDLIISGSIHSDTPVEAIVSGYLYTEYKEQATLPSYPNGTVTPVASGDIPVTDIIPIDPGGMVPLYNSTASLVLYIDTYSDALLTTRVGSQEIARCRKKGDGVLMSRERVKTTTGGYHVLRLAIRMTATGNGVTATVKWGSAVGGKPDISGSYTSDFYVSRYFANGFCLGTSERDYIMAYDQGEKGMRFVFENNGYGLEASDAGLRHRHHNGNWLGMPLLVFKGRYKYDSANNAYLASATKSFDGGMPTPSRSREGYIRLRFPTSWKVGQSSTDTSYLDPDNFIVHVTGFGTVGEGPLKANIAALTSTYIDIMLSDDKTLNDGGFMIDISYIE